MKPKLKNLLQGATSRWDRFWFSFIWLLGSVQILVLRHCIREPVWRSHDGTVRVPRQMTSEHLANAIRYCEASGAADSAICAALRREHQLRNYAGWLARSR